MSGWCFSMPDRHVLNEQVIEEESSNQQFYLGNSPTTEKLQMELKTAVACCVSLMTTDLIKCMTEELLKKKVLCIVWPLNECPTLHRKTWISHLHPMWCFPIFFCLLYLNSSMSKSPFIDTKPSMTYHHHHHHHLLEWSLLMINLKMIVVVVNNKNIIHNYNNKIYIFMYRN